jgi:hypothetical protein
MYISFSNILLVFHAAITILFAGIIWFVQIVHYPLLKFVGKNEVAKYEQEHTKIVMLPAKILMSLELVSGILLLFFRSPLVPLWVILAGLILLVLIWQQTWFAQVPCHKALCETFSEETHKRLLRTNWIRTFAYSLRIIIICIMLLLSLKV